MGLHIITGAAVAGKTGTLHEAVLSAVETRRTAALLLPSTPEVHRARRELSARCPVGLWIGTFDSFLDQAWSRIGDGRTIVTAAQRSVLIRKAIDLVDIDALAASSRRSGFSRVIEGLVMRAGEADLHATAGRSVGSGAGRELVRILSAYEGLLEGAGLVERGRAHLLVAEKANELDVPSCIAVNRFGNLGHAQKVFVLDAARVSDVWLALTWVEGSGATQALDALVTELASLGGELEEIGSTYEPADTPAEISALGYGLGAVDGGEVVTVRSDGHVVLSEGWGREAEAARITREVQDAIAGGVQPGDIAVVFRDPLRHRRSMENALREAGIDGEFDMLIPLRDTGAGRALGQLLSFFVSGSSRRDLLGFLRTRFAPLSDEQLDQIDVRLRAGRISGVSRLLAAVRGADEDTARLLGDFGALCKRPIDDASLDGWEDVIAAMLRSAYGDDVTGDPKAALDIGTMRAVMVALRDMAAVETLEFNAADLLTLLKEGRQAVASGESTDRIQVLGAERMRGRRFSCVILGGLTADEFPVPMGEDALPSPEVAGELSAYGIDMSPRVDLEAERLLFYQVVTRARHRLVLSRQVADEEGRPVRPSPLLEELLDLYRDATAEGEGWYHGPPPTRVMTLQDLGQGVDAPLTDRRALRSAIAMGDRPAEVGLAARVDHALWRNRDREVCLGGEAIEALSQRTVYSASEIESYLGCPYRWYVERVLRPESIDQELDAGLVGQAAHAVMSGFYRRFKELTGASSVTTATLATALQIHAGVAAEEIARLPVESVDEEIRVNQVMRATWRLIEEDVDLLAGLEPFAHEWGFGMGEDPPESFGSFALRGRVDRIDVADTGFIITDYKTGSLKDRQADKFADHGLVQLPLYAEVVRRRLGVGEPLAGLYRSVLSKGKPRGFFREGAVDMQRFTRTDRRTAEAIDAMIDDAIERSALAVEGMRAGRIERTPLGGVCPSYCPARIFCERGEA